MTDDELVSLGVVAKPHGVQGELRVHRYNQDSTLLFEVDHVWLRQPAGAGAGATARRVKVGRARLGPKGLVLMTLSGVSGREAADGLRGVEVAVPRDALPPVEEDEWYHVDLIGLRAVDESGATLGEVIDVVTYPTIDCLVVRMEDGVREVPIVEPWLGAVDIEAGTAVVGNVGTLPLQPSKGRGQKGAGKGKSDGEGGGA